MAQKSSSGDGEEKGFELKEWEKDSGKERPWMGERAVGKELEKPIEKKPVEEKILAELKNTKFESTIKQTCEKLYQEPPTQQEKETHKQIISKLNLKQQTVVTALEVFAQNKGGEMIVAERSSNRPSLMEYLYLLLNEEWPKNDEIEKAKENILVLTLKESDFDTRGDFQFPCPTGQMLTRGGMLYKQPCSAWVRVGLSVRGRYDNGDDDWMAMNDNINEWAVGFHGSSQEGLKAIASTREFKVGTGQAYKDNQDINKKSTNFGQPCGKGVYFSQGIEVAESYSRGQGGIGTMNQIIVLQVRTKPSETRIPENKPDYRILNDPVYIRPYGICVRMKKNQQQQVEPTTTTRHSGCFIISPD